MATHAPTTRRALFAGTLALTASAGLPAAAARPLPRLSDWDRMTYMADQLGDPAIIRVVADARRRPGWTPLMMYAVLQEAVNGEASWLAVQARHHTTHPDWPAVIRHAEHEGYEGGEVEYVVTPGAGPRKGRLVCMLECGREIDATGVL